LDEEHRKDKITLEDLTTRLDRMESEIDGCWQEDQRIGKPDSTLFRPPGRIEQYDVALTQQRTEILKHVEELDKKQQETYFLSLIRVSRNRSMASRYRSTMLNFASRLPKSRTILKRMPPRIRGGTRS